MTAPAATPPSPTPDRDDDDSGAPVDPVAAPLLTRGRAVRLVVFAALATVIAGIVSGAVIYAFERVQFPAYGNSNVLQALTVVGQIGALGLVVFGVLVARWGERRGQPARAAARDDRDTGDGRRGEGWLSRSPQWAVRIGKLAITTGAAALVAASLTIPLAATRLYLHGISVDQEFRSQFLGRTTSTPGLPDMAYPDMPSFYPSGWFWLGGRFANAVGLTGWEAYKPWSVLSLSLAAALLAVLWIALLRTDVAALITVIQVAAMVAYASPEPYGAIVALFAPPVLLIAWHALHPTHPHLGRGATVVTMVFLGLSACFYTLYTAVSAAAVIVMALSSAAFAWWRSRRETDETFYVADARERPHSPLLPIVRLAVIGIGSCLIALIVWAPYLLASATNPVAGSGTAFHYLPEYGARFPLPMLAGGVMGFLCLIGLIWIVARFASARRAQALGLVVVTIYLWCAASMAASALGTTLLGFRTEVLLIGVLSVAGVLGLTDLARWAVWRVGQNSPDADAKTRRTRLTAVFAVLGLLFGIAHVQAIPGHLNYEIRLAYTDTDGRGERADRVAPGPAAHYADIARLIDSELERPRTEVVVATTAPTFLAYYPYLAYQAITSHYANPLGRYDERNEAMEAWGEATGPDDLYNRMTAPDWQRPDVIIARHAERGYELVLASDVFPNEPNVHRHPVVIPERAVTGEHFAVHEVGPFAVIIVR